MISLDSPRWEELDREIPESLRLLESFPEHNDYTDEPWFTLWSKLAHQGDVDSASFAAVPHIVRILEGDPSKADWQFFGFPAWVEVCRQRKSVPIPADLEADYFDSLNRLRSLAAGALSESRDETFVRGALSAIAAANGQVELANAIQELSREVLSDFPDWLQNR